MAPILAPLAVEASAESFRDRQVLS